MNTQPMRRTLAGLGSADDQRAQQIAQLQQWIALTEARVTNQQRFTDRVWQAFGVAKTMQPLCANFHEDYQRAATEFVKNRDAAAVLAQKQKAELKALQAGRAPGSIDALNPALIGVGGTSPAIEAITLSAFGPATKMTDPVYFAAFINRQTAPVHTCQPAGAPPPVAPSAPSAPIQPAATPPPQTLQPSAGGGGLSILDQLPPWAPYAAGGLLLLLIVTGGKKR
jgi:hypothetical protein